MAATSATRANEVVGRATHVLAELTGLRRPSVSLSLRELERTGERFLSVYDELLANRPANKKATRTAGSAAQ